MTDQTSETPMISRQRIQAIADETVRHDGLCLAIALDQHTEYDGGNLSALMEVFANKLLSELDLAPSSATAQVERLTKEREHYKFAADSCASFSNLVIAQLAERDATIEKMRTTLQEIAECPNLTGLGPRGIARAALSAPSDGQKGDDK